MANIKSYNLVGVGSQVQFGKGGLQIAQDSGAFAFRDPSNTNLVNVEVATPTATSHAASKQYVDGLITSLTSTVNGLSSSEIVDSKASPTTRVSTNEATGAVTIDVGGTAGTPANIATFQGGAASDSALVIDNSTSGEIQINGYSATATDVNIYLNPQGNGRVYIGNGDSDSELQADDGQDLTLAGGDNPAGNAGNIILRGGNSSSGGTNGAVVISDSTGAATMTVTGIGAAADSSLVVTNGTGNAEISVTSTATNADLVLAPQGTGAVDVSGAAIHNVATPVNGTDAANKAYVDSAVSAVNSALTAGLVGTVQDIAATVGLTAVNIGAAIKGRVKSITVEITTPYSAGASLTIGVTGNVTAVCDDSQIDESSVGSYNIQVDDTFTTATQLIVNVAGTPTAGAANVYIEYVQG